MAFATQNVEKTGYFTSSLAGTTYYPASLAQSSCFSAWCAATSVERCAASKFLAAAVRSATASFLYISGFSSSKYSKWCNNIGHVRQWISTWNCKPFWRGEISQASGFLWWSSGYLPCVSMRFVLIKFVNIHLLCLLHRKHLWQIPLELSSWNTTFSTKS